MATHAASKDREPLSGLVERVTFHSPETGFCVLRVKVRGHRELVTVLGSAASIQPGEFIQASGRWDNHREHGIQFKTTFLKVMPPKGTVETRRWSKLQEWLADDGLTSPRHQSPSSRTVTCRGGRSRNL